MFGASAPIDVDATQDAFWEVASAGIPASSCSYQLRQARGAAVFDARSHLWAQMWVEMQRAEII
jgi:hypothetical protein